MSREELLAAWLEHELDESGHAELMRALSADDAFAREAADHLQMRRLLGSLKLGAGDFASELLLKVRASEEALLPPPDERAVLVRLQHRRWWQRAGLATAGVAAAAAITLLLVWWPDAAPTVRVLAAEGVGSLDVRALEAGRPVRIEGGILELALGTKTRLVFEGPADFSMESVDRVRLGSGRCYAEMEKGASGLRIETPSGEVLDLGTRFGVEVKSANETAVHVFAGAVEVGKPGARTRVTEGKAVRWLGSGKVESVGDAEDRFLQQLPARRSGGSSWLHWSFDEAEGMDATATGQGFDVQRAAGRIHGATRVPGVSGQAVQFNGKDNWVETGFAGIGSNEARTVACWVRIAPDFSEGSGQAMVGWGEFSLARKDVSRRAAWELGVWDADGIPKSAPLSTGRIKVGFGGPNTVGSTDLRDGQWHHVAVVYAPPSAGRGPGAVLMYVDGQLERRSFGPTQVRLSTDNTSSRSELVQFGRQVLLTSRQREYFKGAIDEVFIVGAALTGDEIRHLMRNHAMPAQP